MITIWPGWANLGKSGQVWASLGKCKILSKNAKKLTRNCIYCSPFVTITLATKAAVKIDSDSIQVDIQLLFQRLIVAAKTDLKTAMEYELCTIPKSLFESPDLLHEPQKSALADSIWTMTRN